VTRCCGPSFGSRSGSSCGEPITKLPAGIDTISSPAPKSSASVNIVAIYFSGAWRTPLSSTVAASKLIVRNAGRVNSRLIEGAAIAAPVPATASAAIPNVCRRVSRTRRHDDPCCGLASAMAGGGEIPLNLKDGGVDPSLAIGLP
jgi:hypothetical protein